MLDYPIKYGLMPIVKEVGSVSDGKEIKKISKTVFYIPSKCYVLNKRINYYANGTSDETFEVVFPYNEDNLDNNPNVPEFDNKQKCQNSDVINAIFDSYEVASSWAKSINSKLIENDVIKSLLSSNREYHQVKSVVMSKYACYFNLSDIIGEKSESIDMKSEGLVK